MFKVKTLQFVPMTPKTIEVKPFFNVASTRPLTGQLLEANDGPPPTREQLQKFKENREEIIESKLFPQIKSTKNVLHGAQSRNRLIKKLLGEEEAKRQGLLSATYDYDVWSGMPKKHAVDIENKLDKQFKSDIAQVQKLQMGVATPGEPKEHYERYGVVTRVTPAGKQEIDYSFFPNRPFKTVNVGGVRQETLKSTYEKAHKLKYQPRRGFKHWKEIRTLEAVEEKLKEKGKRGIL